MKTKTVRISVGKEQVRKLVDPFGKASDAYYALVRVNDLPMDLPLDVNPRKQDVGSRVSRNIEETLLNKPDSFHLMNRGMCVIAKKMNYDNRSQILELVIPEGTENYGVLDGGHTYQVIRKNVQKHVDAASEEVPAFFDAFVRMEVMSGLPDELIVDIARARNTSAQVKGYSLANLEHKFEWLKEELADTSFGKLIAYRENEDDEQFPLDVMEVVALVTMYHPDFNDVDTPPIMAYSSKARCLEMFGDDAKQAGYLSVRPIVKDILKLYDYVHLNFAKMYEKIGGFSALTDDEGKQRKGVRLGKVTEVKQYENGFDLYYLGRTAEYRFPDGWLYPIVAALRALVDYKPQRTTWRMDPFTFFDKHGEKLVRMTLEAGRQLGRNPNAIGKNKPHWSALYDRVDLLALKSEAR